MLGDKAAALRFLPRLVKAFDRFRDNQQQSPLVYECEWVPTPRRETLD